MTFEQIVLANYTDGEFEHPDVTLGDKSGDYRDISVTIKRTLGDVASKEICVVNELYAPDGTVTTSINNGELSLSELPNGDKLVLSKDEAGLHTKVITAQGVITEL